MEDERLTLRTGLYAIRRSVRAAGNESNVQPRRLYDYFAGRAELTAAELQRVRTVIEQHERCLRNIRRLVA